MISLEELCVIIFGLILRVMTSVHPHSGQGQPPMYGDYEAQRHWQEITVNLPVNKWYFNSTQNDLLYWGLDYPPLTAYHSYFVGKVAKFLDPSYVKLHDSRGKEDYHHKIFMRNSVTLMDILIFVPAIVIFAKSRKVSTELKLVTLTLFLTYPGLILIDHGHFQYNNVSLGLFILAVALILKGQELWASMFFVLALSYKQMELYHALPFFFYLLGISVKLEVSWFSSFIKLFKIGSVVILTFVSVWWPFIQDLTQLEQVLHRIFPLNRGIFEDKVANIWCSLNVIYKLKNFVKQEDLALVSAAVTLIGVLPSNLMLFWKPTKSQFVSALLNTSLGFFLCSYQVHEKSILLVAFPALMAINLYRGRYSNLVLIWFLIISTMSMWPLLVKDGLILACIALQIIFITASHYLELFEFELLAGNENKEQHRSRSPKPLTQNDMNKTFCMDWIVWTLFNMSLVGYLILSYASLFIKPPNQWPHLWPLVISVFSAAHFVLFWIYFYYCQIHQVMMENNSTGANLLEEKKKQ